MSVDQRRLAHIYHRCWAAIKLTTRASCFRFWALESDLVKCKVLTHARRMLIQLVGNRLTIDYELVQFCHQSSCMTSKHRRASTSAPPADGKPQRMFLPRHFRPGLRAPQTSTTVVKPQRDYSLPHDRSKHRATDQTVHWLSIATS